MIGQRWIPEFRGRHAIANRCFPIQRRSGPIARPTNIAAFVHRFRNSLFELATFIARYSSPCLRSAHPLPLLAGPVFALIIARGEQREKKNKTTFLLRRSRGAGSIALFVLISRFFRKSDRQPVFRGSRYRREMGKATDRVPRRMSQQRLLN